MTKREELEQTIAALEAQRATLGDAVVDASIAALRQQLAALEPPPEQQRKLVSVLFTDVVGSTRLTRGLDPEEVIKRPRWAGARPAHTIFRTSVEKPRVSKHLAQRSPVLYNIASTALEKAPRESPHERRRTWKQEQPRSAHGS